MLCDSDICVFDIRRDFWCMPNVHSEEFRLHGNLQFIGTTMIGFLAGASLT